MDKLIITNVRKISNYFNNIFNQLSHPDITLIQSYGHKLYVNKNDIGVAQPLILCGVLDKHETDAIGRMIKPGMTILDVGANIGYFTLIAAKLAGKTGKVYAFEPQPENFRLLVRNI
jgi:ubiquinone/menaquinone biosynthesis C-methylase UbiE